MPTATPIMISPTDETAAGEEQAAAVDTVLPGELSIQPEDLNVLFINVGKADAALLLYGGDSAMVDTGTEEAAPQLFAAMKSVGLTALDSVFLTHTHSDHIGGMTGLGSYIPIGRMYGAFYSENKKNGENKISLLADTLSLPLQRLSAGETVPFGDTVFQVLGPRRMNEDDDNDNSLVLRLEVNGRTLLLTGDMQFAEEQTLLDAGVPLSSDVLKVGNHGNPDATGEDFAAAVSPQIAVISTDTTVDTDSANPRVIEALGSGNTHVTQDFQLAVWLNITPDGSMSVRNLARKASVLSMKILSADRETQQITLQNDGPETDISGCMLVSERGGELFRFPEGSTLGVGETVVVSGEGHGGAYQFSGEDSPLHKKKSDPLALYDPFGNVLFRFE